MTARGKILVVDDEAPSRRLLRELLEEQGYEVREAADGEAALTAVAADPPDVVLLDVMMPRRDGYSVCQQLKGDERTRLTPVVIVTSLDELPDKLKAIQVGVDDFLTKPFNAAELATRVRSLVSLKRYTDELEHASRVLHGIALAVERRDAYTGGHCKRVGEYAVRVGVALGLRDDDLKVLRLAGTFHDLGKIAIPDAILRKPARLTAEEMEIIKTHPTVGCELVQPMRTLAGVLPLIRHHHERLDGSGYPDGLEGAQIPLTVRILSVVDIYDALATERPYKSSFPHERCIAVLREEATRGWWDRNVVETVARVIEGNGG